MVNRYQILLFLVLSFVCQSLWAEATASVDRKKIYINETLQLSLRVDDTRAHDSPDISVLRKNFDILGSSKSTQSSWINGKSTSFTEWVYQIAPKRDGLVAIPPITIDNQQTQPLSITVLPASEIPTGDRDDPLFIESSVDKQSIFVQEQLVLTVRINSIINLQDLQLDQINLDNAFINELSNTRYERSINNKRYVSYQIVYAVSPQESGTFTIPALTAIAVVPQRDSFSIFNRGKTVKLRTLPIEVEVKEIPKTVNSKHWLPAKDLRLTDGWDANPEEIQLGDSITRTITVTANGLSSEQLPPLTITEQDSFNTYGDKPTLEDEKAADAIIGKRIQSTTIVPTSPGTIVLPEIKLQWWNLKTGKPETASLPPVSLTVIGDGAQTSSKGATGVKSMEAESTTTSSGEPQDNESPHQEAAADNTSFNSALPWQLATAVSLFFALLFFVLWLMQRSQPDSTKPANKPANDKPGQESLALKELQTACNNADIPAIRKALIHWARTHWPQQKIAACQDIVRVSQHEELSVWVKRIDAYLYSGEKTLEDWQKLYFLARQLSGDTQQQKDDSLKPLYPV